MDMKEIKANAKALCTKCKVCPVCNGLACKGEIPGMGGKGSGSSFIRNVEKLKQVKIRMDVMGGNGEVDTASFLFDNRVSLPVYLAPIAGITNNYGAPISDEDYTRYTLEGAKNAGTIAFTGDGKFPVMFTGPVDVIEELGGIGIPTIKPWQQPGIELRTEYIKDKKIIALATDIDSAGLPLLRNSEIPVENKSVEALRSMKECVDVPFIVKGIMTVEGALKALEAGADGIVISNHGGRVQDECQATIEVLEDIAKAVDGRMTILIDSGFRTGVDVFKALALGADGVLIGRPLGLAAIGGKAEGVELAIRQIQDELKQTMIMTGCQKISDITRDKVFVEF